MVLNKIINLPKFIFNQIVDLPKFLFLPDDEESLSIEEIKTYRQTMKQLVRGDSS